MMKKVPAKPAHQSRIKYCKITNHMFCSKPNLLASLIALDVFDHE